MRDELRKRKTKRTPTATWEGIRGRNKVVKIIPLFVLIVVMIFENTYLSKIFV